ncbi:MAG: glycosyltransferase family 4 protein [Bacteroidota bacterium]|nr:glycosyltransferase family 4 protein [Bacteroidota bacterium]
MKIGVWVNEPVNKNSGGSFTYLSTLTSGIDNFNFNPAIEIVFISECSLLNFEKPLIHIANHQKEISFIAKVFRRILKLISKAIFKNLIDLIDQNEKIIKDESAIKYLKKQGVKIIFYPIPSSRIITGIPFILNNWDLAHYTTYAFPEIIDDGGFHKRNDWYVNILPDALMVFAETETGKKELSNYLNLSPDKISVLPLFVSESFTNIQLPIVNQAASLKSLGLQEQEFFFYPAQFWAHKNHYNLIKAFKEFHLQHPAFKLVLCGSDKGNLTYLKKYVKEIALEDHVIFSGFIEEDVLYTLYKNAKALIMPTFLGPSNIPPIEALHLGCPVLCSDLDGHREILNEAALYFNPLDHFSIFESMQLIMDESTRFQILTRQRDQLQITHHTIGKALIKLDKYFSEAVNIRSCWE